MYVKLSKICVLTQNMMELIHQILREKDNIGVHDFQNKRNSYQLSSWISVIIFKGIDSINLCKYNENRIKG